jgi:hypothetical protein
MSDSTSHEGVRDAQALCDDVRFLVDAFFQAARLADLYAFALDPEAPPLSQADRFEALTSAKQRLCPGELADTVHAAAGRVLDSLAGPDAASQGPVSGWTRPLERDHRPTAINRVVETILNAAQARDPELSATFYPGRVPPVEAGETAADALRAVLDQLHLSANGARYRVRVATWAGPGTVTVIVSSNVSGDDRMGASPVVSQAGDQLARASASLHFHSIPDHGCTFVIRLPMNHAASAPRG